MAETKKQENQVEESRKSVAGKALGLVKKTAVLLAKAVALRKRQQKRNASGKAKSAQEVRDSNLYLTSS